MRTVVITGGTRGIGGALATRLRNEGHRVIALGSADADLTSMKQTAALADRLPDRIDALVLAAGRFDQRRVVTAEGFEQTFAIGVLARFLLTDRLRPALEQGDQPVLLNLSGTGGIPAGRIHWDDLQRQHGYSLFTMTMQGARMMDLLGAGFAERYPGSRVRYVLYNPLFVNSGMHRYLRRPLRTVVGVAARLFGQSTMTAAQPLADLVTRPPEAPLTGLRRGEPVPVSGAGFDGETAARLYKVLESLAAGALNRTSGDDSRA